MRREQAQDLRAQAPAEDGRAVRQLEKDDAAFLQLQRDQAGIAGEQLGRERGQVRLVPDECERGRLDIGEQPDGLGRRAIATHLGTGLRRGPAALLQDLRRLPRSGPRARQHAVHAGHDLRESTRSRAEARNAFLGERPLGVVGPAGRVSMPGDCVTNEIQLHSMSQSASPPYDAGVTPARRVAVIGAGPAGIVTTKELLESGHDPTCFERAPALGGVFRYGEDDGVVWESCRLTSSGLLTAFSDFPAEPHELGHMTAGEYVGYLERYAEAFGIVSRIRYETSVDAVTREPAGGWSVRATARDGTTSDERFDAVAVCSGLHQHPLRPKLPGLERFAGEVIHSADYRRPAQVEGRRVLVVGAGESGADVVAEVAAHAAETVVSLRRGVAVLPRMIRGRPNDYRTCRIANSAADWVFETRNPADRRKLDVYRVVFFPLVLVDKVVQVGARLPERVRASRKPRVEQETTRLIQRLLAESGGTLQEQFGTKSDEWVAAIAAGRCRRVGAVARFDERSVSFEGGDHFEPDLVILCTGFETKLPFIDAELARAPRYLHTFAAQVGPSLAFVGFVRPGFGAIPPLAELQARWFAELSVGTRSAPVARGDDGRHRTARGVSPPLLPCCPRAARLSRRLHVVLRRDRRGDRLPADEGRARAREQALPAAVLRRPVRRRAIPARRAAREAGDRKARHRRRSGRSLAEARGARLSPSLEALPRAAPRTRAAVRAEAGAQVTARVSVIVPTRNRLAALRQALASVEGQTFRDFEVVVVDDGSVDGTAHWLREHNGSCRLLENHRPLGAAAARNRAIEQAGGDYVALLDDDDRWHPSYLDAQVAALDAQPESTLSFADHVEVDGAGHRSQPDTRSLLPGAAPLARLLADCPIHTSSVVLCRREAFERFGRFDENLSIVHDFEWYARVVAQGGVLSHLRRPLVERGVPGGLIAAHRAWYEEESRVLARALTGRPADERLVRTYRALYFSRIALAKGDLAFGLARLAEALRRSPGSTARIVAGALRRRARPLPAPVQP